MIHLVRFNLAVSIATCLAAPQSSVLRAAEPAREMLPVTRFASQAAHALAFADGQLYVARERQLWRITPDGATALLAELPPSSEKTPRVWALAPHSGRLYGAAHDRIIRVDPDGTVTTEVPEAFTGPCGVTDLAFDQRGDMYVTYDKHVARYTPEWKKQIVLDGTNSTKPIIRWLTSLRIDQQDRFWLSDVFSRRVLLAVLNADGMLEIRQTFQLPEHPEYLAVADDGRVYVGFPDAGTLAVLNDDGTFAMLTLSSRLESPTSMAFGGAGFDHNLLYVACGNGIFAVRPISR